MNTKIKKILNKKELVKSDIVYLLCTDNPKEREEIRRYACQKTKELYGNKIFLRGLIEFSNICINDCYYCGIRKSNKLVKRYLLSKEDIIKIARFCAQKGFGSVVLQSGERQDEEFIEFVEDIVRTIKKETITPKLPNGLGITLCVGEQKESTYKRFFDAGAHRYLLRIETSSSDLFANLHPSNQKIQTRIKCLKTLKKIGFVVGTGVMIGLPFQKIEDLAEDILFFKKINAKMIGMGPYIFHSQTPMNFYKETYLNKKKEIFDISLRMIAVTRIVLKNVNIAATTALQTMHPMGREYGLLHGANVVMPLVTPKKVRKDYQLYDGKPCINENSEECFKCIKQRIESVGKKIALNEWGDN
jgi:biotin synthase